MDDKELERLAQDELLQEAKRAQLRAEGMGPVGWQRCPIPATNKQFLHNMLVSTLEPRRKKSRGADTEFRGTKKEDSRPFQRERNWKAKSVKNQNNGKDRNIRKSQQNTSSKSKRKRKAERPTHCHKTTEKRTKP